MKKEIYEMHDGIPIWQHLMNNGHEHKTNMRGHDYGMLAERLGKRELKKLIKHENLLDKLFPDINIISTTRKLKRGHRGTEYGDYALEISYKDKTDTKYGKKVAIFEIKHGKIQISQQQIRRYSNFIIDPAAYFRKADEVRVIFLLFTEINTMNATAQYHMCEFNPKLARKIVNAIPKNPDPERQENIFALMNND